MTDLPEDWSDRRRHCLGQLASRSTRSLWTEILRKAATSGRDNDSKLQRIGYIEGGDRGESMGRLRAVGGARSNHPERGTGTEHDVWNCSPPAGGTDADSSHSGHRHARSLL